VIDHEAKEYPNRYISETIRYSGKNGSRGGKKGLWGGDYSPVEETILIGPFRLEAKCASMQMCRFELSWKELPASMKGSIKSNQV